MTGRVVVAVLEQLVEPKLGRLGVVKRNAILENIHARKISGANVFSMAPHIDLGRVCSERTSIDVDLVVTHRGANLVDVVGEVRRSILAQVPGFLQLLAAGSCRHRIEWPVQISFQVVIGIARFTIKWIPLTDRKSTRLNSSHMSISYAV